MHTVVCMSISIANHQSVWIGLIIMNERNNIVYSPILKNHILTTFSWGNYILEEYNTGIQIRVIVV
jgi:hypothetical protein